jgi:hypothetical protein
MRRVLLLAAALATAVSGAYVVASSSPAWASGAKITCTTLNGDFMPSLTVSGCSGGNTGGGSYPGGATALTGWPPANGGTINWLSGSTTTIGPPTISSISSRRCPDPNGGAEKFSATVTADTGDGIKVPGRATWALCTSRYGFISALRGLKVR